MIMPDWDAGLHLPQRRFRLALISLAGIPLTGGFMGKFYLFSAAIQQGYIGLVVIGCSTAWFRFSTTSGS